MGHPLQSTPETSADTEATVLELMFSTCPAPMLLVSQDGRIALTNPELDRMFDYPRGSLIGLPVEVLVPLDLRRGHIRRRNGFAAAPARRPMGGGLDLFGIKRGGQKLPLELGIAPVFINGVPEVLVTAIDVSARHAVETELQQRLEELDGLNADLRHISRSASHGLKAPLTSICGLLSLALEDLGDGNIAEARMIVEDALRLGRRGSRLIESVNDLAAGEPSPVTRFALGDVVARAWASVTERIEQPPILTLELTGTSDLAADRSSLEMMLGHLLSNACRYADTEKPEQTVTVAAMLDHGSLRLTVADNGVGVAERDQHRVFYAFDRLNARSGDGFGLTLVRRAAERLGGAITFTSQPGKGSVFTLTIPAQSGNGK